MWLFKSKKFYTLSQKRGTAMGTPSALVFTAIYLAMLETVCFEKCKLNPDFSPPLLYRRFVDDKAGIFLEKKSGEIFMDNFNKLRPHSIQDNFSLSNTRNRFSRYTFISKTNE